jgi:hypothetical protein
MLRFHDGFENYIKLLIGEELIGALALELGHRGLHNGLGTISNLVMRRKGRILGCCGAHRAFDSSDDGLGEQGGRCGTNESTPLGIFGHELCNAESTENHHGSADVCGILEGFCPSGDCLGIPILQTFVNCTHYNTDYGICPIHLNSSFFEFWALGTFKQKGKLGAIPL